MRPTTRILTACLLATSFAGGRFASIPASAISPAPALSGAGLGVPISTDGGPPVAPRSPRSGALQESDAPLDAAAPTATTVPAFRGMGSLAFRRADGLYVLDGRSGAERKVDSSTAVDDLSWSPDGRWLAYIARNPATGGASPLWLVRADGSDRHQMKGLPALVESASWSPVSDTLAVTLDTSAHPSSWLWLAMPTGAPQPLTSLGPLAPAYMGALGVRWSPDGASLAVSLAGAAQQGAGRGGVLAIVPSTGGRMTRVVTADGAGIEIAGWWPNGKGLLYWVDPMYSGSLAADGMQLFSVPLGGKPTLLTRSLPAAYRATLGYPDWLSWSPDGRHLLLVAGGGRPVWDGKRLALCDVPAASCRLLPEAQGAVAIDPVWSPSGQIAYVRAKDANSFGFSGAGPFNAWIQTRALWLADATGAGAHRLAAAGAGIYWPHWAPDGRHLLYMRDHAVWLIDGRGGAPQRIASIISTEDDTHGYYGHVDWSGILAYTQR